MNGIDSATLCRLAGIKPERLRIWIHRAVIVAPPGHRYDLAQTLGVALLARRLDRQESPDQAARYVLRQLEALATLIRAMAAGQGTGADRVILFDAYLADGDRWPRIVTTDGDLTRLIGAAMRRGLRHLEIDDISAKYCEIMAAFREARAEQRARVPT